MVLGWVMHCRCSSRQRTGRLSAGKSDAPPLDVWIEEGRVVHAEWGRLRDLSALEMAALLPAVGADVRFRDGERTSNRTLDLSAIDVTSRIGGGLTCWWQSGQGRARHRGGAAASRLPATGRSTRTRCACWSRSTVRGP